MTGSVYTATLLEDQARRAEVADMMRAGDWRGVINTFQVQWGTAEVSYRHPFVIKTKRKARNAPSMGLWVPRTVSLWLKRAGVAAP